MLRHAWLQGTFLGTLVLLWMVWHGRPEGKKKPRTAAPKTAGCANSKDAS